MVSIIVKTSTKEESATITELKHNMKRVYSTKKRHRDTRFGCDSSRCEDLF